MPHSNKPILFVDIDGVLNPFGGPCPPGYMEHDLFPDDDEPIRVNPEHTRWLTELSHVVDIAWGTGWPEADRKVLLGVLPLPPFIGAAAMPPVPFEPARKVEGISRCAANRPAAWIDDVVTPAAVDWATARSKPTLLVETESHIGLLREHVDRIIRWARELPH